MRGSGDSPTPADAGPAVRFIQRIVPDFIRRRITLKLALTMVVVSLPLVIFVAGMTVSIADHTDSTVETEFAGDADRHTAVIEQWQNSHEATTKYYSANETYADTPSFTEMNEAASEVRDAHLLEDDGTGVSIVATSINSVQSDIDEGQTVQIGDLSGRAWLDDAGVPSEIALLSGRDVYMSDVYTAGDTNLVGFLSPVAEDRYLLLEARAGSLEVLLRGARSDDIGFTQVVTTEPSLTADAETVVFDNRPGVDAGDQYTNDDLLQRATADGTGSVTDISVDDEGESYIVGHAAVDNRDWVVLVHAPRSELVGPTDLLTQWGLFAAGFGLLFVVLVGVAYGRSLSNAIRDLTVRTDDLLQGNFDTRFYTPRIDAIGALCERLVTIRDRSKPADATDESPVSHPDDDTDDSADTETDNGGGARDETDSVSDESHDSESDLSDDETDAQSEESSGGFNWVGGGDGDSEHSE